MIKGRFSILEYKMIIQKFDIINIDLAALNVKKRVIVSLSHIVDKRYREYALSIPFVIFDMFGRRKG